MKTIDIADKSCDPARFTRHELADGNAVHTGYLPDALLPNDARFEELWALRPHEPQQIRIGGRWVEIPRRQKAYGRDYQFSGQVSEADPVPEILDAFQTWSRQQIDDRLNGLLLNWYIGELGQYIGPHHDDTRQLVPGSSIVTISLGEQRIFRLTREEKRNGRKSIVDTRDFVAEHGSVILVPWETNLAWKHSVPRFLRYRGRRISVTLRAFA